MNFANLFRIALRALGNNKMRGFLTMLGIIIGVASVITMLAIGQGSKRSIRAQIAEMGSNMIMIHPGADMRGGVRQDPAAMQSLKLDDYQAIVDETRYVSACSPSVSSSGQAIYGSNNYPTSIYGINPDYLEIRKYTLAEGDMFTEEDILGSAKVCVVGKTIVDNLFTNGENPVGQPLLDPALFHEMFSVILRDDPGGAVAVVAVIAYLVRPGAMGSFLHHIVVFPRRRVVPVIGKFPDAKALKIISKQYLVSHPCTPFLSLDTGGGHSLHDVLLQQHENNDNRQQGQHTHRKHSAVVRGAHGVRKILQCDGHRVLFRRV